MRIFEAMRSIQEYVLKIKGSARHALGEWGVVALILLVALVCFGLGRLSALLEMRGFITLTQTASAATGEPRGGGYIAGRRGSVYYYPWCGGAARIAPQERLEFATANDAEMAGYRAAKNCKGLARDE
jgi:hypothetical protein